MCVGVYDFIVYIVICYLKMKLYYKFYVYIKFEYMIMLMGFNKIVCYNLSFLFVFESVCCYDNDELFFGVINIGFVIGW